MSYTDILDRERDKKWAKESVVKFDDNIAYEEDIDNALQQCITLFGPIGRYIHPPKRGGVTGGVIFTPKYGKLWYGDIAPEDLSKLVTLQDNLHDEVSVLPE